MDFQNSASCELKTLNSPELKRNFSHGHWTRQFVRYSIAPTIRHRDRVPSWTANAANTLLHSLSFYTLPPQGNRRLPFAICRLRFAFANTSIVWQKLLCQLHMPRDCDCDCRCHCDFDCRYSPPSTQNKRHRKNAKNLRSMQIERPRAMLTHRTSE